MSWRTTASIRPSSRSGRSRCGAFTGDPIDRRRRRVGKPVGLRPVLQLGHAPDDPCRFRRRERLGIGTQAVVAAPQAPRSCRRLPGGGRRERPLRAGRRPRKARGGPRSRHAAAAPCRFVNEAAGTTRGRASGCGRSDRASGRETIPGVTRAGAASAPASARQWQKAAIHRGQFLAPIGQSVSSLSKGLPDN